ncbi:MAG: WG repeat-containing protein [Crocinitomicaceae bacterium]|nr:WG repeat-containing protein [Crocinitomicaceae bacterium]
MNRLLFFIFCTLSFQGSTQFKTYTSKTKMGLKCNETIIFKAKKNLEIIIESDRIAVVKNKKSTYYIDCYGNEIFVLKNKNGVGFPFHDGSAIIGIKNKDGSLLYGAINDSGNYFMPAEFAVLPEYFGQIVAAKKYAGDLYSSLYHPTSGFIVADVDSIYFMGNLLFADAKKNITHSSTRKKLFSHKTKTYTYTDSYETIHVIDPQKGNLLVEFATDVVEYENYTVITDFERHKYLFDKEQQLVFEQTFSDYLIMDHFVYCLGDSTNGAYELTLFDPNTGLIETDIEYVGQIDEGRYVFAKDSLQYIGKEDLSALSPSFMGFGPVHDGWRIIYDDYKYGYMNDSTYYVRPFRFPIIASISTKTHGGGTNPIGWFANKVRNFGTHVGNFGRALIGKSPHPTYTYTGSPSYTTTELYYYYAGFPFVNNYAKIRVVPEVFVPEHDYVWLDKIELSKTYYSFIDTNGHLISSEKYGRVNDFVEGRALVQKEGSYNWTIIDESGKNAIPYTIYSLYDAPKGHHIFTSKFYDNYGLMDSSLNVILKPKYKELYFSNDTCYEKIRYGQPGKLRYVIPN